MPVALVTIPDRLERRKTTINSRTFMYPEISTFTFFDHLSYLIHVFACLVSVLIV